MVHMLLDRRNHLGGSSSALQMPYSIMRYSGTGQIQKVCQNDHLAFCPREGTFSITPKTRKENQEGKWLKEKKNS